MRARSPWMVALVLIVVALAAWRASCVVAGPDIDTDAYAHHMIARAILADPRDLAVHWVWLPLFHYVQVPLVLAGGTMEHVRWANVAFSAALPVFLFAYVRRTARSDGRPTDARMPADAIALLAAAFAGACPIAMQMGTTAQPEPLFALLVLGVAIAFERRWHRAAAAMLAAAVMLRYEAWAVLVAVAVAIVVEPAWGRWTPPPAPPPPPSPARGAGGEFSGSSPAWIVVAAPVLLIGVWAVLRRPVDGQWFGFLRQTHEFAAGALPDKTEGGRGLVAFTRDLLYYPIVVPVRVLGPVVGLSTLGVVRTVRQQGGRFVLVFLACLGFVSLSWVMHSTLGLDRHFVAVVPLYATFAAQGVAVVADWGVRIARRFAPGERASVSAGRALGWTLALGSLAGLAIELDVWMGFWRASVVRGWPDRAALGEYLRSLSGAPTIFCDDATIEMASGLDRRRFDRHWVDDPHTWDRVAELARAGGEVYVATWRRKLHGHENAGPIVFRAGFDAADRDGTGVAAMRVTADGGRSER
jgi:hypothetical protein